jgi:hypothetical protein
VKYVFGVIPILCVLLFIFLVWLGNEGTGVRSNKNQRRRASIAGGSSPSMELSNSEQGETKTRNV